MRSYSLKKQSENESSLGRDVGEDCKCGVSNESSGDAL